MASTESKCWLDILPDEIHLNILSRLDKPLLTPQFCCMQAYPRWRNILQGSSFIEDRIRSPTRFFPTCHELFNIDSGRALRITTAVDGQVTSVTVKNVATSGRDIEDDIFCGVELVGPGILDDPLFSPLCHLQTKARPSDDASTIKGISIGFSRQDPESNRYVCSSSDQWLFDDLPESEKLSIRDLISLSVKLAMTDEDIRPNKGMSITLKMTAEPEYGYIYFGGWIMGEFGPAKDPLLVSTNTITPFKTRFKLHDAVRLGNIVLVKQLIRAGAPLELEYYMDEYPASDQVEATALSFAAIHGSIGGATILLDAGADIETCNSYWLTPLHLAAEFGHLEIARLLVERGADKEARRDTDETPLHFAVEENHYEVAKYLLDAGADMNAPGSYRGTPLDLANTLQHFEIVELLKSYGAKTRLGGADAGAGVGSGSETSSEEISSEETFAGDISH